MSRVLSLLFLCAAFALPAARLHAQAAPSPDAAPQGMPGRERAGRRFARARHDR